MKLDLQLFTGLSLTVVAGDHVTASAASTTGLAKDDEVQLTITPSDGYEAVVQVIGGGAAYDAESKKIKMGEADATVSVTAKAGNLYKVTEECSACLNGGTWTVLHRNVVVKLTPNGAIESADSEGTAITVNAAIQNLIDTGVLVKI